MSHLPREILLSGYARVGKDSVRDILVQYGYTGMAFADGVRVEALEEDRFLPEVGCRYKELLEREGGYEAAKSKHPCVRVYLVDIGHGRRQANPRHWIDRVQARVDALRACQGPDARVCISDCRYANERLNPQAQIWMIRRPGVGPANPTEGESIPLIVPDRIIENDGTLDDLRQRVTDILGPLPF